MYISPKHSNRGDYISDYLILKCLQPIKVLVTLVGWGGGGLVSLQLWFYLRQVQNWVSHRFGPLHTLSVHDDPLWGGAGAAVGGPLYGRGPHPS